MKIVFYECEPWEQEYFRERLSAHELVFVEEDISSRVEDAQVLVPFIYTEVSRAVLEQMPSLELVATRSTGFDHIDVEACKERGVAVCNVPFYGENTVAEHTFALLLAISRNVVDGVQRVRAGSFDAHGLQGFDLKGKTLGVIGTGHIGRHVIRMARGFEMRVVAYDPFPDYDAQEELEFSYMGLDELLSVSDVVTLHCPYNEHTHHLLDHDNLACVKQGAVLLNTARGGLVNSEALLAALQDGRLSAAGLDVIEEESHIKEERQILSREFRAQTDLHKMLVGQVLIHLPNVLVTPHNAFNSREALVRILDTTVKNVESFIAGNLQNGL